MKNFKLFCITSVMFVWSIIEIPFMVRYKRNSKIGFWLIEYYDNVESGIIQTLPIYKSWWFALLGWILYITYALSLPILDEQSLLQYWTNFLLFNIIMIWTIYLLVRYRDSIKD